MDKDERKALMENYHERYVRWTDKALSQMSFFNDFILTLSLGFLSFAYKDISTSNLRLSGCHPNWHFIVCIISLIIMLLSLITGLVNVLNRLADFRITREITQIKYWMSKHADYDFAKTTPKKYCRWKRRILTIKVVKREYPKISIENCQTFNLKLPEDKWKIDRDFKKLRNISHNLGRNTWEFTSWQVCLFGISIFLYFFGILIK